MAPASEKAAPAKSPAPEVRLSRTFKAPRAVVFKAWSSAEHVKRWFCPAMYSVPDARVELRVGGPFEVCMRSPEGVEHWSRGRVTEVVNGERLAFEGQVCGADGRPLFTAHTRVGFIDVLGGTQVDVVQSYTVHDPAALAMIGGASIGWGQTLDRLQVELVRMLDIGAAPRSVVHGVFTLERTYAAPPAKVWKALTDPQAKARWFAGTAGQWELLERSMDVRPGGREKLKGRWHDSTVSNFEAVYFDVVPQERLVYTYDMYIDERKISVSLATMQLKPAGAGTTLTVTEQGAFLDGYDDAGSRERGTGFLLDALGASLKD